MKSLRRVDGRDVVEACRILGHEFRFHLLRAQEVRERLIVLAHLHVRGPDVAYSVIRTDRRLTLLEFFKCKVEIIQCQLVIAEAMIIVLKVDPGSYPSTVIGFLKFSLG